MKYVIKFPNGAYASWQFGGRVEISDLPSEPYVERVASFEDMKEHIQVWEYYPQYDLELLRKCGTIYLEQEGEKYRNFYTLCMGAEILPSHVLNGGV